MSHTKECAKGTTFSYNSDFSGDVFIANSIGVTIEVPGYDLLEFMKSAVFGNFEEDLRDCLATIETFPSSNQVETEGQEPCKACGRRCNDIKSGWCCLDRLTPPIRKQDVCKLCQLPKQFAR